MLLNEIEENSSDMQNCFVGTMPRSKPNKESVNKKRKKKSNQPAWIVWDRRHVYKVRRHPWPDDTLDANAIDNNMWIRRKFGPICKRKVSNNTNCIYKLEKKTTNNRRKATLNSQQIAAHFRCIFVVGVVVVLLYFVWTDDDANLLSFQADDLRRSTTTH